MKMSLKPAGRASVALRSLGISGLVMASLMACGPRPQADSLPKIFGGSPVPSGRWENVVGLGFKRGSDFFIECTGTIIAPRVVLTAGHCLDEILDGTGPMLRPGLTWDDVVVITGTGFEGGMIPSDATVVHPNQGFVHENLRALPRGNADLGILISATDWLLPSSASAEVDMGPAALPIVPLLSGIRDAVQYTAKGHEATLVGYGAREDNGRGLKYEVVAPVLEREGAEALVGGNGKDSCNGDSGGPAFVRGAPSAPWHLAGIVSRGLNLACGTGGIVTLTPDYICWLEEKTGIPFGSDQANHGCKLPDESYSDKQLGAINFQRLCRSASTSPMQRHTIDAIKLTLHANECGEAGRKLALATTLDLSGLRIRDLSPLAHAPALRALHLSANKIENVSVLRTMKALMNVDLSFNSIRDFSPLTDMIASGLKVKGTFLQAPTFLQTRFKELCDNPQATPAQQKTTRAIRSRFMTGDCSRANLLLARQKEFRIVNREITDLTPFSNLENLTSLDLTGNPVSDITPLAGCSNLKVLDLTGTNVTDISPLADLLANGLEIRRATP